jgi:hypothetical protein
MPRQLRLLACSSRHAPIPCDTDLRAGVGRKGLRIKRQLLCNFVRKQEVYTVVFEYSHGAPQIGCRIGWHPDGEFEVLGGRSHAAEGAL